MTELLEHSGRAEKTGLLILGVILIAGLATERYFEIAGILILLGIVILTAGSVLKSLILLLFIHIMFSMSQLGVISSAFSLPFLRPDELLLFWIVILWCMHIVDDSVFFSKIGLAGWAIVILLSLMVISMFRGLSAGFNQSDILLQVKLYAGYFVFFPAVWALGKTRNAVKVMLICLLIAGSITGFILMYKGFTGTGMEIAYREKTGLRIVTRQINAIAAILLLLLANIWKADRKIPLVFTVPAALLMAGSVILSQTRGIWMGVLVSMLAAWVLNLFRREEGKQLSRKIVTSLAALVSSVTAAILSVSFLGILSTADIIRRTGSETGNYFLDISALARILSWFAVSDQLQGIKLITGCGLGATITYFRPDFMQTRTMWFVDGSFFQIALNMGLVGVVVLVFLFGYMIYQSAKLFLITRDNNRAAVALGVFCTLIMIVIASFFASPITNYRYHVLWAVLMALIQVEMIREKRYSLKMKG